MFNPDLNQKPINVMPKSVILLIFLVAFVEFVLQLGQKGLIGEQALIGWRMELIQKYGFLMQSLSGCAITIHINLMI